MRFDINFHAKIWYFLLKVVIRSTKKYAIKFSITNIFKKTEKIKLLTECVQLRSQLYLQIYLCH